MRSGCRWNHLPKEYPDDSSVHRTYQRWQRLGVLDRILGQLGQQMNGIAAEVAKANGAIIADGFTPMKGLATVATHMTEASPDIHPLAIGYDLLTGALVTAR